MLYSVWERKYFDRLEDAVAYGKAFAEKKAVEQARQNGAVRIDVVINHEDIYAQANQIENDIYIQSHIEAIATERPEWERCEEDERFFVDTRDRGL